MTNWRGLGEPHRLNRTARRIRAAVTPRAKRLGCVIAPSDGWAQARARVDAALPYVAWQPLRLPPC